MYPIPLVELVETHKGERMVVMTITAGCARSLLRAAKERWRAAGALDEPSAYHPDCTRHLAHRPAGEQHASAPRLRWP